MWNVVQIKTLYQHFSAQICSLELFHSYLTNSKLNWGRANKTTLLPLIRLHNKAVRTLEYYKTKTAVLNSKHKILKMLDLFRLSVTKFMCGKVGHSRTRGTVVFFYFFKKLKTLNFKVSMVI